MCLRLADELLARFDVDGLALLLGDLVVFGALVADEVEAARRGRGVEQIVDELVGIAALGPADHAPHGDVPALALVPDDLAELLARGRAHLDLEAELPPRLRDQLRRLEGLRHGALRVGIEDDLAHRVAGGLGGGDADHEFAPASAAAPASVRVAKFCVFDVALPRAARAAQRTARR